MLPVMSSAPRGKFRALSLYSFRGLSPVYIEHVKSITNTLLLVLLHIYDIALNAEQSFMSVHCTHCEQCEKCKPPLCM